jgi:hypothetical protein
MVIWPHKRQSGKSGQNTPDSGSRKRHLIGAEKGLFEYCVVGLSCIGQNAKAQIVERDSGFPQLAEIYTTLATAPMMAIANSPAKRLAALFTPEAPDWLSGALTMTTVVKGATTSAIPKALMTVVPTTPIQ